MLSTALSPKMQAETPPHLLTSIKQQMKNYFLLLFTGLFLFSSCLNFDKKKEEEPENEDDINISINIDENLGDDISEGINEGIEGLQDALNELSDNLNDGKEVEVADFRDLKKLFPERINGMKRISSEGERSGWSKFKVSTAEAVYEDGDRRLKLEIIDTGGLMGLAQIGINAWMETEIDRETETGYERTTTIDDHPAYEKYDTKREEGELSIIVGKRFVFKAEGWNVSEKDLRSTPKKVGMKNLERMSKG